MSGVVEAVNVVVVSERSPADVCLGLVSGPVAELERAGYALTQAGPDRFVVSRSYRSTSVWVLGLLTLPFGLVVLALLRRVAVVTMQLVALPGGGTRVTITGESDSGPAAMLRSLTI